jgi:hypothetical protein
MMSLVGKVALIAAMALGTALWGETEIAPMESGDGPCSDPGSTACCIHQCIHDSSTGCNGGSRCCTNLCA